MDVPVLAQVAILVIAVAMAVPGITIVAMTVVIPFLSSGRRREAHRCLDKLIRFTTRDRATLASLLRPYIHQRPGGPP